MAKKTHLTYSDEYKFLKSKIQKILTKASTSSSEMQRARKRIKKFVRRLIEIEQIHKRMGWPHPESIGEIDPNRLNEKLKNAERPEPRATFMPDGSLPKQTKLPTSEPKLSTNPDGTLPSKRLPDENKIKGTVGVITNPDGSLPFKRFPEEDKLPKPQRELKQVTEIKPHNVNPDGTLMKTPMLEGSDPKWYADDQVEKFFNKPQDDNE